MLQSSKVFADAGMQEAENWQFVGVFASKEEFCEAKGVTLEWADDFSSDWLFIHTEEGVYVYEYTL